MDLEFTLRRSDIILGKVIHVEDDFPNHVGTFLPTDGYLAVAHLFEMEHAFLEGGDLAGWRKIRDEIDRPGLTLVPNGGENVIVGPMLHIDGNVVWWR